MANRPPNSLPPLDSRVNSTLPSLLELTLREILDRYSQDPEVLKSVLYAKAEEDKLKAEELRYKTELVRFETKRMEVEVIKGGDHFTSPQIEAPAPAPTSLPPPLPSQTPQHNNGASNFPHLGRYTLSSYSGPSSAGHHGHAAPTRKPEIREHSRPYPPPYSARNEQPESNYRPTPKTIQLKDVPSNYGTKRRISREEVLEAVRNKVKANTQSRGDRHQGTASRSLLRPSTTSSFLHRSSPDQPTSQAGPTLSTLQPRDISPSVHEIGPFSAPAGGPHMGFRYPPPSNSESQSHRPTGDA